MNLIKNLSPGKNIMFLLLIISYLSFSYNYFGTWWHSWLGSILIVTFGYLTWKNNFLRVMGLRIKLQSILYSIILTISLIILSIILMKIAGSKKDIILAYKNWKNTFHIIFYVLNEEIVLGAITLYLLIKKLNLRPLLASLLLALAFSLVHLIFYRWIFNDRVFLQSTTLITLFLVGIVRNNLILQAGHIGYSWALHVAWMIAMFGFDHYYEGTRSSLTEAGRFDLYLGSVLMLIISGILALISIYFILIRKIRFNLVKK